MDVTGGKGEKEIKLLFEEMDGGRLKIQGKGHKKATKQEMKMASMYEDWVDDGGSCSRLSGKTLIVGMKKAMNFMPKEKLG